jgi:hypothetical protein
MKAVKKDSKWCSAYFAEKYSKCDSACFSVLACVVGIMQLPVKYEKSWLIVLPSCCRKCKSEKKEKNCWQLAE